ncbi:MAG: HNH endonuclease [Bacteroidales bacterium]|jgi:hypothetical protein
MKLEIELVPQTSFYNNVRSHVSTEEWDILRRECYQNASYKCEICGGIGDQWPVECHEKWEYDDIKHIQKLTGFIALCPNCHKVKHFGRTQLFGEEDLATSHFMKVNNLNKFEAKIEINKAIHIWEIRSQYNWILDINLLTTKLKKDSR